MKGKWSKCFLLLGTIIILVISAAGSFILVRNNLSQAESKYVFESIYVNANIDFIIPSPSDEQVREIEGISDNGIEAVTPYYETSTSVYIGDSAKNGTVILLPDINKVKYTPYTDERILNGNNATNGGEAVVDETYADKNSCGIGDTAKITIAGTDMTFSIVGVSEKNTYYNVGTIALVLTEEDANTMKNARIVYSAAYVKATDVSKCKSYLYNEYKPYGRLKDQSAFASEDTYNQHVQNFNDSDWGKEITNCAGNYDTLKVKYENVESAVLKNAIIYAVIAALAFIVLVMVFLSGSDIQKVLKLYLVKKGGTIQGIKKFYSSGIIYLMIVFIITNGLLYYWFASQNVLGIVGAQLINLIVPVGAVIIVSIIMIIISGTVIKGKYKIKKGKPGVTERKKNPINRSE